MADFHISFSGDDLKRLKAVMVCASKNDVRYYLNGLHIDSKHVTGTDGHRMARFTHNQAIDGLDVIIPRFTIPAGTEYVSLDVDPEKQETTISIGFKTKPAIKSILSNIDGRYPDVDRVIPDTASKRETHSFSFNPALITDVQKARGSIGCTVSNPDAENSAYTVSLADEFLQLVIMPIRV